MKRIFRKLFISFSFLCVSQSGAASDCFIDAANNGNLLGPDLGCITAILATNPGPPGIDTSSMAAAIPALEREYRNNSNDQAFEILSQGARQVYYNSDFCGHAVSSNVPRASCDHMRHLSLLHPDGQYENNFCNRLANGHPHCSAYMTAIASWMESRSNAFGTVADCDSGLASKLYCDDTISSFMQTDACDGRNTTESNCLTYLNSRFTNTSVRNSCTFDNWNERFTSGDRAVPDMGDCTGAGAVTTAGADADDDDDADDSSNPAPESGPGDVTGGDNSAPEETPTSEDEEDLIAAMDQAAADTFGGMPGNFQQASLDATTQVPGVSVNGPGGGDVSGAGLGPQGGGFNPGSSTAIPGVSRLARPTRGAPGGKPKNGGGSGAAGGGAGAGGGGVAGAGGLGNQGGGARGGGGRRRGGGASVYNSLAKNMNSGFLGTDGPGASSSGGAAAIKESPVDKKIKKAIADNKKNNLDKAALQRALDKNLNTPGGRQELVLRSSYFPSHSEVYLWLHQQSDILDESGK